MLNKLTKIRHRHASQKNKETVQPRLDGIAAYSFDNCSVSSQSSSRFSSETVHAPSDGFASYAETTYSVSSPDQWVSSKGSSDEVLITGDSHLPCYEDAEERFLEDFVDYFEYLHVDNIRKEQYPKLDLQRLVYLDYANSALFSKYQRYLLRLVTVVSEQGLLSFSLKEDDSEKTSTEAMTSQERSKQAEP
ncbi:hypothetical protein L7F22_054240 [Adiantum nelumboides]|nr:hypothetical protein [Adiantum nelumboides]